MHPQPNMIVLALVGVVSSSSCWGHVSGPRALQSADPQVFCGRSLAKALALLCSDDVSGSKRSGSASIYDSILSPHYKNGELQLGWSWISPREAKSLMFSGRDKRYLGVVNECCDKACSINELLTYC